MRYGTMRRRSWRATLATLVLPLALGACGDDDPSDPDDDARFGTWAFTEDGITNYVRITDDAIEIFSSTGTCFIEIDLAVEDIDGDVFVVDTGGATVEWTVEEVGNNLVVEDDEGVSRTLVPSSQNLGNLAMCEPFDPETDDFPHASCASLTQLNLPGSVAGDLGPGSARWADSTWYDVYRLTITATTDVNITMEADNQADLDSYLLIYPAAGGQELDENDDIESGNTDARVQTTLEPGCYIVVAGSWQGDEAGETGGGYTLTASTTLVSDFPHATCTAIPEIPVGGSVNGTLANGDTRWSDDSWYDLYSLQLDAQTTVDILMEENGSGIDTYLMLYNALGTEEINADDDISGSDFNSLIDNQLLPAGCYIIVANSYEGDDVGEVGGAYTLSVD